MHRRKQEFAFVPLVPFVAVPISFAEPPLWRPNGMISSVIFDLDGTLTKTPSPWRYVHERLGVWENTACNYFDEWSSGKMSYEEFCRRDTSLWNGREVQEIYAYLDEIEWNRHVPAVVERLVAG